MQLGGQSVFFVPPRQYPEDSFWGRVQKDEQPKTNKYMYVFLACIL